MFRFSMRDVVTPNFIPKAHSCIIFQLTQSSVLNFNSLTKQTIFESHQILQKISSLCFSVSSLKFQVLITPFFVWTAALGNILTIDNLRKRQILILDWCCMCKRNGESVDHLLIHCPIAFDLWSMVFTLFGIHWVMPKTVVDLLACWQGKLGRHWNSAIWMAVPHCLMCCIWRERNNRHFEDLERSVADLKLFFLKTLLDWVTVFGFRSVSSVHGFIDFCTLCT